MTIYRGNEEHIETAVKQLEGRLDIIICADLIYLDETFEDLVKTLRVLSERCLDRKGNKPLVLVSYKIRLPELTERFLVMLREQFDVTEELDVRDLHPNPQEKFIKCLLKS